MSGDPFRRFTGRRDEREARGLSHASERCSPAAVECPLVRGDDFTARGSGSCGLSRRLASRRPCVNGRIGLSPAGAQCGLKSQPPAAYRRIRCRRRISQPPGSQSQAPSIGFSQRPPLHRNPSWCPLPRAGSSHRLGAARRLARSALAVSHGLDGFLHQQVRGLVASRSRS
jgi:hypothetical protein